MGNATHLVDFLRKDGVYERGKTIRDLLSRKGRRSGADGAGQSHAFVKFSKCVFGNTCKWTHGFDLVNGKLSFASGNCKISRHRCQSTNVEVSRLQQGLSEMALEYRRLCRNRYLDKQPPAEHH